MQRIYFHLALTALLCLSYSGLAVGQQNSSSAPHHSGIEGVVTGKAQKEHAQQSVAKGEITGVVKVRVKDIARVRWGSEVHTFGYGIVVGLDGTGDSRQVAFTVQSIANMLKRFGIAIEPQRLQLRNVAAVMVTAVMPPFAKVGDRVDAVVSAIGDARSLQGGVLLQTPLQAADGDVYAIAQGPVSIGGFNVQAAGARVQRNHPTVGRVVNGAIVVKQIGSSVDDPIQLQLLFPDIANAQHIAEAINKRFGERIALVVNPKSVVVTIPSQFKSDVPSFVATLEQLEVVPDMSAKVVVNERTGTIVIGGNVRILPVVISHGALQIEVMPEVIISQPPPLSPGAAVIVPQAQIRAKEQIGKVAVLKPGDTVEDLVRALNALRLTPRDIIAILQALKDAGALLAELEVQ